MFWTKIQIWLKECNKKAELDMQAVLMTDDLSSVNHWNHKQQRFIVEILIAQTSDKYKTRGCQMGSTEISREVVING